MTANPKPDAAPIDLVEKLLSDEPMTRAEAAEEITRLRAELAETLKKLANQRSVAETYYKNANEQFQRANELERALAEARALFKSAHEVGFAAGIEAAAYHDNFLMTKTSVDVEKVVASTEAIRALAEVKP